MALQSFAVVVVVVLVSCLLAPPAIKAQSVNNSTYWGTTCAEGSVIDACNANLFSIVNIGFVDKFGAQRTPTLNVTHCDPLVGGCKYLGAEIQACQEMGIKVLISIGGPGGDYNLTSADDAKEVANYLYNNYLDGRKPGVDRPFGDNATLDGVDFLIDAGTTLYWDVLANKLKTLSAETQMELSATPKCQYPDHYLGDAIQKGVFDYAQVRFYNETGCQYNGEFIDMEIAWYHWTAQAPVKKIFVGVTASEEEEYYIDPYALKGQFLPYAKESQKYGGVMVWNFFSDRVSNYSKRLRA